MEKEVVDENEARNYANEINSQYGKTSALNGDGINEIFNDALNAFVDDYLKNNKPEDKQKDEFSLKIDEKKDEKTKGCC